MSESDDYQRTIKDIKTLLRDISELKNENFLSPNNDAETLAWVKRTAKEWLDELKLKYPGLEWDGL